MGLVLASSSPRRKKLMEEAGYHFRVMEPASVEIHSGPPWELVVENARRKALSVGGGVNDVVIGADTVVLCGGTVLGKPGDEEDARRMLHLQMRAPQKVYSGLAVHDAEKGKIVTGYEVSAVVMSGGAEAVETYISSGMWKGKAGSFGIQDDSHLGIRVISGEKDNVTGMPMVLLERLLSLIGFSRGGSDISGDGSPVGRSVTGREGGSQ